jgi:hypothetical protein
MALDSESPTPSDEPGYHHIRHIALEFFRKYVSARIESLVDGTFDIVSASGIELGSYGRRSAHGHTWLYATGLATPRLTWAIQSDEKEDV